MNSFRSAILSGKGLHSGDPIVRQKKKRGAAEDDLSTVAVPRTEIRTCNQRDDDRHRLDEESARARFEGEEHDVDVINLSGGGAMIRCDFAPRLWERVDLIFAEGAEIAADAQTVLPHLARALGPGWRCEVVPTRSQIGSGALPLATLPSAALAIRPEGRPSGRRLSTLAAALRRLARPVIGRIAEGALLLDLRCLPSPAALVDQLAHLPHAPA